MSSHKVCTSASGRASATAPPIRMALVCRIMALRSSAVTSSFLTVSRGQWFFHTEPLLGGTQPARFLPLTKSFTQMPASSCPSSLACGSSWRSEVEKGVPVTHHA